MRKNGLENSRSSVFVIVLKPSGPETSVSQLIGMKLLGLFDFVVALDCPVAKSRPDQVGPRRK